MLQKTGESMKADARPFLPGPFGSGIRTGMERKSIFVFLACVLPMVFLVRMGAAATTEFLSDAPDEASRPNAAFTDAPTYEEAARLWKTPEDVNAWIGGHFSYDMDRARQLASSGGQGSQASAILAPEELFTRQKAICVDLARFGVETLAKIAPDLVPRYLRIDFEPLTINGVSLRFHWLALFKRDGQYYFFADSKRPGHMAGPYPTVAAFLGDYEQYRKRAIASFQELDTFRRKPRATSASPAP